MAGYKWHRRPVYLVSLTVATQNIDLASLTASMARTKSLPDDLIHRTIQNIEQAKGIKRMSVDRATMRSQRRPPCKAKQQRAQHDTISLPSSPVPSRGSEADPNVQVPGTAELAEDVYIPDTHIDNDDEDIDNSSETLRIPDTQPLAPAPARKDSTVQRLTTSLNASTALLHSLRLRNELYAADLARLTTLSRTQPRAPDVRAPRLCSKRRAVCVARFRRESRGRKGWMWAALGSLAGWGVGAMWVLGRGVEMEYVRRRRRVMYGLA